MTLVELLSSTGARREIAGPLRWVVRTFAAVIAVAVIYVTVFTYVDLFAMTIAFLSAMLTLVFPTVGASPNSDPRRPSVLDLVFSLSVMAAGIYFFIESGRIIERITLLDPLTVPDVVFSSILLLLTIEATRRTVGMILTAIVIVFLAYNLWGDVLPGKLAHGRIDYLHFLDIMMFTTDGIFGTPIRVAATYAFLFVLFGTFLSKAGGAQFFFDLAAAVSGRRPGGPAKIAVVSSGLYGMLSGSPTSDVVVTGSVTIPMMKRLGYRPAFAGAVEVAASTGGSLLPPVMGSAAFIMAEFTGIAYREIAIAAIIPALLYYLCIYFQVHLRSLNLGHKGLSEDEVPRLKDVMKDGGIFLVPLAVLTVALLLGYSPSFVAVYGTASVVVVAAFRRRTRMGLVKTWTCLAETTLQMLPVVGACAAAGLVVGGLSMTGLANKLADLIFMLAGDIPFLTLVVAAVLVVLLGMGMPTPSVFTLSAVLVGPTLNDLGFPVLQSNMFLLYFSALSAMTPPIAVAAFAAAAIADANPLQIAALAVRLSIAAFIVPFAFIYGDGLLLAGDLSHIALNTVTAVGGVALVSVAAEGYLRDRLSAPVRLALGAAGIALIAPSLLGVAIAAGLVVLTLVLSSGLRGQSLRVVRVRAREEVVKPD